ncbi:MAG: deoxyribonuclease IV [Succinivibrionaceae bacterium]
MLKLGCHLSFSRGFEAMIREAISINANVIQFFTRNPRGGSAKPLDLEDVARYNALAEEYAIGPLLAHAPYTMNPAAAVEDLRTYAFETMSDDLMRLSHIPGSMYNFHPGSHVKQGVDVGIRKIADLLGRLVELNYPVTILLETMAGKGSEIGGSFDELASILRLVGDPSSVGICLDTCHICDGGYDVINNLEGVLKEFDSVIGLSRLKAVHLNDSIFGLGSHKDRHALIGEGQIGLDALSRVINHPVLKHLPFYLETPNDVPGYGREIALLRSLYQE